MNKGILAGLVGVVAVCVGLWAYFERSAVMDQNMARSRTSFEKEWKDMKGQVQAPAPVQPAPAVQPASAPAGNGTVAPSPAPQASPAAPAPASDFAKQAKDFDKQFDKAWGKGLSAGKP